MYGTFYAKYPEILLDSYQKIGSPTSTQKHISLNNPFLKLYLSIFGIPDVSFQLRAKYFEETLKSIPIFSPQKILDAGSGIGFYSLFLRRLYPDSTILGVDIDKHKLSFCRQLNLPHAQYKYADITKLSMHKQSFDLIVNIDVLEHIQDYQTVLKNFYRLLKPGGYLYIHTPQINQQRYFKKFFSQWSHEEHVREGFDPVTLASDLTKIGYTHVTYWHGFGPLSALAWELNHIAFKISPFLAALAYPNLYSLSLLDNHTSTTRGLTAYYLATK